MDRENGKGILFGILGIMTLIIAILGASLAYFTATARSNEDAVQVQSATVTITYVQGQILSASNLIPATQTVVNYAYARSGNNQCLDANDNQVCAVFRFQASNTSAFDQEIQGYITTTTDVSLNPNNQEFENLKYIVYDVTDTATQINSNPITFAQSGSTTNLFDDGTNDNTVTVEAGTLKTYEVLIWLDEIATASQLTDQDDTAGNQDFEQGLTYTGMVTLSVVGANSKVTGVAGS